jgi:excisionase family DNA binding protein
MNTFRNAMRQDNRKKDEVPRTTKSNVAPYIVEIDGLCDMLNIGKNTAYNLLTSGEIDSFKVGSVWKIPVSSVTEYIERKCRETRKVKMYTIIHRTRDLGIARAAGVKPVQ